MTTPVHDRSESLIKVLIVITVDTKGKNIFQRCRNDSVKHTQEPFVGIEPRKLSESWNHLSNQEIHGNVNESWEPGEPREPKES